MQKYKYERIFKIFDKLKASYEVRFMAYENHALMHIIYISQNMHIYVHAFLFLDVEFKNKIKLESND